MICIHLKILLIVPLDSIDFSVFSVKYIHKYRHNRIFHKYLTLNVINSVTKYFSCNQEDSIGRPLVL